MAKTPDFEKSLAALEALVQRMESGELSLSDALSEFEKGVGLIQQCQQSLEAAKAHVDALLSDEDATSSPAETSD